MGNFTTSPRDIAVLVIDKTHPKYGKIASLSLHDWRESGDYHTSFGQGEPVLFNDRDAGKVFIGFYRTDDGSSWDYKDLGPVSLQKKYLELKVGTIDDLARNYKEVFREELPRFKEISELEKQLAENKLRTSVN